MTNNNNPFNNLYGVKCLEDDYTLAFQANSPMEAMEKCLYSLNMKRQDDNAKIMTTKTGKHLYMEHCGRTFAIAI
mgnify:CR=1 FL=1